MEDDLTSQSSLGCLDNKPYDQISNHPCFMHLHLCITYIRIIETFSLIVMFLSNMSHSIINTICILIWKYLYILLALKCTYIFVFNTNASFACNEFADYHQVYQTELNQTKLERSLIPRGGSGTVGYAVRGG